MDSARPHDHAGNALPRVPLGWGAARDLWIRRELRRLLAEMTAAAARPGASLGDKRTRCAPGSRREAAALLGVQLGALRPKWDRGTLTITFATLNDPER